MNRRDSIFSQFPQAVAGYELDPERGYFSVIIPEATTNLLTNTSGEVDTTGFYPATGAGVARGVTFNWQAYGAVGYTVTPASGVESGLYDGTTLGLFTVAYTFSVTLQGDEGKIYYAWFADNAGGLIGTKRKWIATGRKQRIWVTTTPGAAAIRLYVTRDSKYTDTNMFYLDGFQLEQKDHPTTYCDGDQKGFVLNDYAYIWNGEPHLSTSTRSSQTRTGGREVKLLDYGLRILSIIGLGMSPLVDQSLNVPGSGELYQGTGTIAREFSLIGSLFSDTRNPRRLQSLRSDLIDAFKPDIVTQNQPLILRYQACDEDSNPTSESIDIVCVYTGGLEGNWDNHQQERLALQFKMHFPLIYSTYSTGLELGFQEAVTDFANIGYRDLDGVWNNMGTGANGEVNIIRVAPDGSVYAGGAFTLMGGVAGTSRIAQWIGGVWVPLGTGGPGASVVYDIVIGLDGTVYVAGSFANWNGIAAADNIVQWDPVGATWSALGTGMNDACLALALGPDGYLYCGGNFTSAGGVADTSRLARWNGTTWESIGAGADASVRDMVFNPSGILYITGAFTTVDGVSADRVARGDIVGGVLVWSALGIGMPANGGNAIAVGLDGTVYVGGDASTTNNIRRWNGTVWLNLGSGTNDDIFGLTIAPDGSLYVGGQFTEAGGLAIPERIAVWDQNQWLPLDLNVQDVSAYFNTIAFDRNNQLYLGGVWTGSTALATNTEILNLGSANAYPIITITGPGQVWHIKNQTTGKSIYFNNLILASGEVVVINFEPKQFSLISNLRGNILGYISPISDISFNLVSGSNNISVFIFGSTDLVTNITMHWKDLYWSVDGAAI